MICEPICIKTLDKEFFNNFIEDDLHYIRGKGDYDSCPLQFALWHGYKSIEEIRSVITMRLWNPENFIYLCVEDQWYAVTCELLGKCITLTKDIIYYRDGEWPDNYIEKTVLAKDIWRVPTKIVKPRAGTPWTDGIVKDVEKLFGEIRIVRGLNTKNNFVKNNAKILLCRTMFITKIPVFKLGAVNDYFQDDPERWRLWEKGIAAFNPYTEEKDLAPVRNLVKEGCELQKNMLQRLQMNMFHFAGYGLPLDDPYILRPPHGTFLGITFDNGVKIKLRFNHQIFRCAPLELDDIVSLARTTKLDGASLFGKSRTCCFLGYKSALTEEQLSELAAETQRTENFSNRTKEQMKRPHSFALFQTPISSDEKLCCMCLCFNYSPQSKGWFFADKYTNNKKAKFVAAGDIIDGYEQLVKMISETDTNANGIFTTPIMVKHAYVDTEGFDFVDREVLPDPERKENKPISSQIIPQLFVTDIPDTTTHIINKAEPEATMPGITSVASTPSTKTEPVAKHTKAKPSKKLNKTKPEIQKKPVARPEATIKPGKVPDSISSGDVVIHNKFGRGSVEKLDANNHCIHVKFAKDESKMFTYPDVFTKGLLFVGEDTEDSSP